MQKNKLITALALLSLLHILSGCEKPLKKEVSEAPLALREITSLAVENKQEVEYLLKELRQMNPFYKDHTSGLPVRERLLIGIIWDEQRPLALIGDSAVAEGDSLNDKKVIKILKDSVILESNGIQETLQLD